MNASKQCAGTGQREISRPLLAGRFWPLTWTRAHRLCRGIRSCLSAGLERRAAALLCHPNSSTTNLDDAPISHLIKMLASSSWWQQCSVDRPGRVRTCSREVVETVGSRVLLAHHQNGKEIQTLQRWAPGSDADKLAPTGPAGRTARRRQGFAHAELKLRATRAQPPPADHA
jgi:hypothetical protein